MSTPGRLVLIDTMIIFEAYRTGCWKELSGKHELCTVEKVVEESLRGRKTRDDYIEVDASDFERRVRVAKVTDHMLAAAFTASPRIANLDDGEQHLLAYMYSLDPNERPLILTTADRAAVYAACELGFQDQLTSLEELMRAGTIRRPLKKQYSTSFLTSVITQFLLGG